MRFRPRSNEAVNDFFMCDQGRLGYRDLNRREGTTILLVEQNFMMAKALGDRVAVMDDGRVVHSGAMRELAEDEGLQQRLLGLSLGAHQ